MDKDQESNSIKEKISPLFKKLSNGASGLTAYFKTEIIIDSLVQVPYITGLYYCKWKLPSTAVSEDENTSKYGSTLHCPVKSHAIVWEHPLNFHIAIPIDKEGELKSCIIFLYVKQEWETTGKSERIGEIKVNLSEYATISTGKEVPFTLKTILLNKSKTNAALRLSIKMEQYQHDTNEIVIFRPARSDSIKDKATKSISIDDIEFSSSTIGGGELTLDSLQDAQAQMRSRPEYSIYDNISHYSSLLTPQEAIASSVTLSSMQCDNAFLSSDPLCLLLGPEAYSRALDQSKQLLSHNVDT